MNDETISPLRGVASVGIVLPRTVAGQSEHARRSASGQSPCHVPSGRAWGFTASCGQVGLGKMLERPPFRGRGRQCTTGRSSVPFTNS